MDQQILKISVCVNKKETMVQAVIVTLSVGCDLACMDQQMLKICMCEHEKGHDSSG